MSSSVFTCEVCNNVTCKSEACMCLDIIRDQALDDIEAYDQIKNCNDCSYQHKTRCNVCHSENKCVVVHSIQDISYFLDDLEKELSFNAVYVDRGPYAEDCRTLKSLLGVFQNEFMKRIILKQDRWSWGTSDVVSRSEALAYALLHCLDKFPKEVCRIVWCYDCKFPRENFIDHKQPDEHVLHFLKPNTED